MDRNKYLETVAEQIRCKRAVPFLKQELADHIEDQKEAYIVDGMDSEEAEAAAVREMGDPVETGVQLNLIHRPKMNRKVLTGTILLGLIGLAIQLLILTIVYEAQLGPAYSAPYYLYAMDEIVEQMVITAGGIMIMLAVCYVDYTRLFKHVKKMWIILNVLLFGMGVLEFPIFYCVINGVNRNIAFVAYLAVPLYGALIYAYKNQGQKGILKSLISLLIFLWLMTFEVGLGFITMIGIIMGIVFVRAIRIDWFKLSREKIRRKTGWFAGLGIAAALGLSFLYEGYTAFIKIPDYYRQRFQLIIEGNTQDYVAKMIKAFLQTGEYASELPLLKMPMQSDYVWLAVVEALGVFAGIFLILICGILAIFLLRRAYKEKNKLGHFVAISCTWFLIIETVFNIGGNFGRTPFMGSFMPFLAYGKVVTVVSYFYMGILLSIFRNTNVVRN